MIDLTLLGPGTLLHDGATVPLRSTKTFALLAFLAVEHETGHARARLAELLWPGHDAASARHSVRQALHALRTAAAGALAPAISVDGEIVRFVGAAQLRVDIHRFEAHVAGASADDWRAGAALYTAPLLHGRRVADAESYDGWLEVARERVNTLAIHNLDRLAADSIARGDLDGAFAHARALLALDRCNEVASRHLLRIAGARRDVAALQAEWARVRAALAEDYDCEPTDTTRRLHATLMAEFTGAAHTLAHEAGTRTVRGTRPGAARSADADALVRAARGAERVYAFGPAVDLYGRALVALGEGPEAPPARRLEILLMQESALDRLGRRREQLAAVDAMLDAIRDGADSSMRPTVQLRMAGVRAFLGDHDGARTVAASALAGLRAAGDRPGEAEALRELGFAAWRAGDHALALVHARAALDLHRALGDPGGEASALHNLAELHRELGSPKQALPMFERALELHWAAGNRHGEILTRFGIAQTLRQAGEHAGASAQLDATAALASRHGERTMEARAWHLRAAFRLADGDVDGALEAMQHALDIDRAIHFGHGLGHDLVAIAALHARRGEVIEARAALFEAAVWFEMVDDPSAAAAARSTGDRLDAASFRDARDASAGRPGAEESGWWPPVLGGQAVRSCLPLAEGKVYCTFESPLARAG